MVLMEEKLECIEQPSGHSFWLFSKGTNDRLQKRVQEISPHIIPIALKRIRLWSKLHKLHIGKQKIFLPSETSKWSSQLLNRSPINQIPDTQQLTYPMKHNPNRGKVATSDKEHPRCGDRVSECNQLSGIQETKEGSKEGEGYMPRRVWPNLDSNRGRGVWVRERNR